MLFVLLLHLPIVKQKHVNTRINVQQSLKRSKYQKNPRCNLFSESNYIASTISAPIMYDMLHC